MSQEKDDAEQYLYDLVEFPSKRKTKSLKDIECLPASWVSYNSSKKQLKADYPMPPYTNAVKIRLQRMIEYRDDPDSDWPRFRVIIKGRARTYNDALQKIEVLKTEEYAFSNMEEDPKVLAAAIEERKKQEVLQKEAEQMQAVMAASMSHLNIPSINEGVSSNEEKESSEDSPLIQPSLKKRKRFKRQQKVDSHATINEENHLKSTNSLMTTNSPSTSKNIKNNPMMIQLYSEPIVSDIPITMIPTTSGTNEPIYNVPSLDHIQTALTSLQLSIDNINKVVTQVRDDQKYLMTLMESSQVLQNIAIKSPSESRINSEWSIKTVQQFQNYEKELSENEENAREKLIKVLHLYWDPKYMTLSRHMSEILQRILSREVAIIYTSTEKVKDEKIMKVDAPTFNKCLIEFFQMKGKWLQDDIQKTLGVILSNSIDWDGNRINQPLKKNKDKEN